MVRCTALATRAPMVVVWGAVALGILIALPGPMFLRVSTCRGSRYELNLPSHPPDEPRPTFVAVLAPSKDSGESAIRLSWRVGREYFGGPLWMARIDHPHCTMAMELPEREALRPGASSAVFANGGHKVGYPAIASNLRAWGPRLRWNPIGIVVNFFFNCTILLLLVSALRIPSALMRVAHRARLRALERARLAQMLCPTCRYDLRGLPSNVCPECGMNFAMETSHA
ncbi:MAG: hypothetical protein KDA20_04885 [Phycisphaerales bacterium]|nr:hypothetical protein [Phycisphaerales bacterium]